MIRIANNFTIQQLLDNQVGSPLEGDDKVVLIVEMPFTSNPNGWVTGSLGVTYDTISFIETPQQVANTFTEWVHQSFIGLPGYNSEVDKLIFSIDPDGYLAVEPRPGLGFQFKKYNSFSGPYFEDVQVKDMTNILGIDAVAENTSPQCPLFLDKRIQFFVDIQTGESVSVYQATTNGDQYLGTVLMGGDGSNQDTLTFLQELKSIFTDSGAGVQVETFMDSINMGGELLPSFELTNSSQTCAIFKLKAQRNSDADSRFYVKVNDVLDAEDPLYVFPRAEQNNYLTVRLPVPDTVTPEPIQNFIKFRNTTPSEDRRLELIPTNPMVDDISIIIKDEDDFELGGTEEGGYGICLSRDLCALTGKDLSIGFNNEVSTEPSAVVTLIDKRRGKVIGSVADLHLIDGRSELLNLIVGLLRTSGLNVVLNIGELNWGLAISNPTQKDITVELYLPLVLPIGSMPLVGITGDVNTLQKVRDLSVYGANYSIAFCVAASAPPSVCQLVNTPWSNDITFDDVNLPNSAGNISVSVADTTFGGWNVGVNLTTNNTIEAFIQNAISQMPPVGIEYRISPNNPNAINIRYMGGYTGDPTLPDSPTLEPREYTFAKMDPGPTQDNRDQPWAQGTMAETKVCLANFFTDEPTIVNCYNTDTFIGE